MSGIELTQQQFQPLIDQLDPQQKAAFQQSNQQQKQALLQPLHEQQQPQLYRVFRPKLDSIAHDPLDPAKRYHTGVFVEQDQIHGLGTQFYVTGNIIAASGMRYEELEEFSPGQSAELHIMTQIGVVLVADFDSGRISEVLRGLPRPTKQQGVNFWKKSDVAGEIEIIWTKEDGEPYGDGDVRRPVMKCNEWTDLAVRELRGQGILRSVE